ncbi:MAG: RsmE family RNA methyltransferase [Patescibacteria group bacterium]
MRLNRFYLENFLEDEIIELRDGPIFHQLKNVLRIKKGDLISFFNQTECVYIVREIDKRSIIFDFQEKVKNNFKIKRDVILFQSIIKRDKMDWVIQKATELGVSKIVPVVAKRSEKKDINLERLKRIAIEASEQCGRISIPEIVSPINFTDIWTLAEGDVFIGDFSGTSLKNEEINKSISIIIGPEGGFDKKEIDIAKIKKTKVVSLDNYILRSETASLSFLVLLTNL